MSYVPIRIAQHTKPEPLAEAVERELFQIAQAINVQTLIQLEELTAQPTKLRDGLVVFADGTKWNPGAGRGIYAYYTGSWRKLG